MVVERLKAWHEECPEPVPCTCGDVPWLLAVEPTYGTRTYWKVFCRCGEEATGFTDIAAVAIWNAYCTEGKAAMWERATEKAG